MQLATYGFIALFVIIFDNPYETFLSLMNSSKGHHLS